MLFLKKMECEEIMIVKSLLFERHSFQEKKKCRMCNALKYRNVIVNREFLRR